MRTRRVAAFHEEAEDATSLGISCGSAEAFPLFPDVGQGVFADLRDAGVLESVNGGVADVGGEVAAGGVDELVVGEADVAGLAGDLDGFAGEPVVGHALVEVGPAVLFEVIFEEGVAAGPDGEVAGIGVGEVREEDDGEHGEVADEVALVDAVGPGADAVEVAPWLFGGRAGGGGEAERDLAVIDGLKVALAEHGFTDLEEGGLVGDIEDGGVAGDLRAVGSLAELGELLRREAQVAQVVVDPLHRTVDRLGGHAPPHDEVAVVDHRLSLVGGELHGGDSNVAMLEASASRARGTVASAMAEPISSDAPGAAPASPSPPPSSSPSPGWRSRLLQRLGVLGPLLGLLLVWSLFAALTPSSFATWNNQLLILLHATVVATAAFGATMIIISGGIDLSVGSTIALSAVVAAWVVKGQEATLAAGEGGWVAVGWPVLAVLAAVGVAVVCGLWIGVMVIGHVGRVAAVVAAVGAGAWVVGGWDGWALGMGGEAVAGPEWAWVAGVLAGMAAFGLVLGVNEWRVGRIPLSPFIVTLGMFGIIRGLARAVSGNRTIYSPSTWLRPLVQHINSPMGLKLEVAGGHPLLPAPAVLVMLALGLVTAGILRYTRFGRHIFAIGSSEATARLCGVRVERTKLLLYTYAVGLAGVAGVMAYASLGGGAPNEATGLELQVIAAVVIGGASLSGGEGSILGTLVGTLIIGVVANGATKLGLPDELELILTGSIIIAAVAADQIRHRRPG